MTRRTKTLVGVDVGASAIKVVWLSAGEAGLRAIRVVKVPLDQEPDTKDQPAVEQTLRAALKEAGLIGARAPVTVAGTDVILRYQYLMPSDSLDAVELANFEVNEVGEKVPGAVAYNFDTLEVPAVLNPTGTHQSGTAVLTAMAKNHFLDALDAQLRTAGIRPTRVVPAPLALSTALAYTQAVAEDEIVLAIDLGAEHSTLAVMEGARPFFLRAMPFGGLAITRAIARRLDVDLLNAERAKQSRAKVMAHASTLSIDDAERVLCASATDQAEQLCSILRASLRFAEAQLKCKPIRPARIFITGGASQLPGLPGLIEERLEASVEPLNLETSLITEGLSNEEKLLLSQNASQFTAAIGCALTQWTPVPSIRLKSAHQRQRERFRTRDLYVYAGVVLFLAALVFRTFFWLDTRSALLAERKGRTHLIGTAHALEAEVLGLDQQISASLAQRRHIENAIRGVDFPLRILAEMVGEVPRPGMLLPENLGLVRMALAQPTADAVPDDPRRGQPLPALEITLAVQDNSAAAAEAVGAYLDRIPYKVLDLGEQPGHPQDRRILLFDRIKETLE